MGVLVNSTNFLTSDMNILNKSWNIERETSLNSSQCIFTLIQFSQYKYSNKSDNTKTKAPQKEKINL